MLLKLPKKFIIAIIDKCGRNERKALRFVSKRCYWLNPIHLLLRPMSLVSETFQWPKEEWQCEAVVLMLDSYERTSKPLFSPRHAQLLVARATRRNQGHIASCIIHAMGGTEFVDQYMWGMSPYREQWMRRTSDGHRHIIRGSTWSDHIRAILAAKEGENNQLSWPGRIACFRKKEIKEPPTKRDKAHTYINFYRRWVERVAGRVPTVLDWLAFEAGEHGQEATKILDHGAWCPYGCSEDKEDFLCNPMYQWVHNGTFDYSDVVVPPTWAIPFMTASARVGGNEGVSRPPRSSRLPVIMPVLGIGAIEALLCAAIRGGDFKHLDNILRGLEINRDAIPRVHMMHVLFAAADLNTYQMQRCVACLVFNEEGRKMKDESVRGIISLDKPLKFEAVRYLRDFTDEQLIGLVAACKAMMNPRQREALTRITQKLAIEGFAAGRGHLAGSLTLLMINPMETTDTIPESYKDIVISWFIDMLFQDDKRCLLVSDEAYSRALICVTGSQQVTVAARIAIYNLVKELEMSRLLCMGDDVNEWLVNPYKWWRYFGPPNKTAKRTDNQNPEQND